MAWSLSAGVYAFVCATAMVALLLSPVSRALGPGPAGYRAVSMAAPVAVVGAVVWWAVVERRGGRAYPLGAASGLATAFLTVLFWVLAYAAVWGAGSVSRTVDVVSLAGSLIAFVLAVTLPAGVVAGVALLYARRRLGGES